MLQLKFSNMKTFSLILFFFFISYTCQSQIKRMLTSPAVINNQIPGYSEVTNISSKKIAYTPSTPPQYPLPIDEDSTTEDTKLYRYADNLAVTINMSNGNITTTSLGKVWTLRIVIPMALNIGFTFNQFSLSSSAEMYIFNEYRTVLDSGITQSIFSYTDKIGISPMKGNSMIIYIIEPNNFGAFQSSVEIQKVEAGFQEIKDVEDLGIIPSGPTVNCDPMVLCQPNKINSARAVARFFSNGFQCTGTLINNEDNNGRAFFLTAFHCIDVGSNNNANGNGNGILDPSEINALADSRIQFQFWRNSCNGTIINEMTPFSGAILRAFWPSSDIVLLELRNPPGVGDGVNYAGWSRQTYSPADYGSYIIHHPQGEDMRITNSRLVKTWYWNTLFWTAKYSSGTVDKGSSGSALFNENDQIVGQLKGGWSNCNYTDFGDRYGKFSHSWNAASLQQWLSPNQGLTSTNTLALNPIVINGFDAIDCSGNTFTYSVPNLLGCTYTWTVPNSLTITGGQNTPILSVIRNTALPPSSGQISVVITDTKGRRRVVTLFKNFSVGAPPVISGLNPYINVCLGTTDWELGVQTIIGTQTINQYLWTRDGNSITGNTNAQYFYESPATCMAIGVRGINACGTGSEFIQTFCPPCPTFKITVSPNPVKNQLLFKVESNNSYKGKKAVSTFINVSLVETGTGIILKTWKLPSQKEYRLSIAGVKKGNYTLSYNNGVDNVSTKIIVD